MLTRRTFQLFTFIFLLLALSTAAVLANPKLLLPDGSPRITGEWVFYVGAKKTPYRVFLQRGPYAGMGHYPVSGYMLSPKGIRYTFDDGALDMGNGSQAVFTLRVYEGQTLWECSLDQKTVNSGKSMPIWRGEAQNRDTYKRQAVFTAQKKNLK